MLTIPVRKNENKTVDGIWLKIISKCGLETNEKSKQNKMGKPYRVSQVNAQRYSGPCKNKLGVIQTRDLKIYGNKTVDKIKKIHLKIDFFFPAKVDRILTDSKLLVLIDISGEH